MNVPGSDVILAIVLFIYLRQLCWDKGIYFSSNVPKIAFLSLNNVFLPFSFVPTTLLASASAQVVILLLISNEDYGKE